MIFHLGTELPDKKPRILDADATALTDEEVKIIKEQIRKNSRLIQEYLARLDLLVVKERYPQYATFIKKIRRKLDLLMEENDTFRNVLWKHYQAFELRN